ncbi:hypothetical protein JRG66_07880 [Salinimicrobium tongyeongense]|jgi:hypothetical protein|uniref:Uncharacterized protein n=1 Tax=Salinimicrobium tongyeongense TaxID=2809707 RepID=A0ABY6NMB2_9FLAO|nr:hypothetical protein [Salinimicrobium tongyeongense]UZH53934.1 hypothetical protein JRG66_07880 [Salinimicrobium tongyeongense]
MSFQQEHLPKDQPASEREGYGFSLEHFLEDQWMYLVGILIVLGIFFYARYAWRKRNER